MNGGIPAKRGQSRPALPFVLVLLRHHSPDHIHLLIALGENYIEKVGTFGERTLQNWISAFKQHTSKVLSKM